MTQKMTEENKPFVMATLSGVAYKDPEEAKRILNNLDLQNTSILTEMVLSVTLSGMMMTQW